MIPVMFKHQIFCWTLFGIISAGHISSIRAETPERPKEIDQTYKFDGKNMKGYGAEVNAGMTHINQLFGDTEDSDALLTSQKDTEKKFWLGIAMKIPAKLPKEPGTDHELRAIEVTRIMPGSGAEVSGLQVGDLIVGIDGEPIEDKGDKTMLAFGMTISKKHIGDKVKLRVLRGESSIELDAMVKPYPRVASVLKAQPDPGNQRRADEPSLLDMALKKGGLTDEYARLRKEFRNEADRVVSPLVRKDNYNPFRLQEVNYVLYNPLELPVVARKITDQLQNAFNKTHHDLATLVQTGHG